MRFRTRINLITSITVAVVIILNTVIIALFISDELRKNVQKTAEATEQQQMLAIEQIIDSVVTMTQKPMINAEIVSALTTDYSTISNSDDSVLKNKNEKIFADFFYTDMFYQHNYIYAVTIIPFNQQEVFYKQFSGRSILNLNYESLPWYQKVTATEGNQELISPAHKEDLYRGDEQLVISISRLLIDPTTNQGMGVIRIDLSLKMLEAALFNSDSFQQNDSLLLDQEGDLLLTTFPSNEWESKFEASQKEMFMTEVTSKKYGFKLFTFLPKASVYDSVKNVLLYIFVLSFICLIIAILSIRITTKQMIKPIQLLNQKMQQVRQGDLSVRMPIQNSNGDFEEVLQSFNTMVGETQNLITLIKQEEIEKQSLEYRALQSQISQHFISNTISSIRWMAYMDGNESVEKALDSFYHLLNFAARNTGETVSVATELEQMSYYVDIISLRYLGKFEVNYYIDNRVKDFATIKYLLQTLVENSVFHGLEKNTEKIIISISIQLEGDQIIYQIDDNGVGIPEDKIVAILDGSYQRSKQNGIGINNINRRIQLIFGAKYGISIKSVVGEYTKITVIIPAKKVQNNENSNS